MLPPFMKPLTWTSEHKPYTPTVVTIMKTFTSATVALEFKGKRKEAMIQAQSYLTAKAKDYGPGTYSWRADDDSRFCLKIDNDFKVSITEVWNARKN